MRPFTDLAEALVHRPGAILVVGLGFLALDRLDRRLGPAPGTALARPSLALAALAWLLFAAWEWLVMTRTPGANIRVDLLLIWPLLLVLSLVSALSAVLGRRRR